MKSIRNVIVAVVFLFAGAALTSCEMLGTKDQAFVCGQCGQMKGEETCCKEGTEDCGKCGLDKGSPGCCKIEKGKDVALCGKCSEIKGSKSCCAK